MTITKLSKTVFTPLEHGGGVLLNLNTLAYFKLNKTGAVIWEEIESADYPTVDSLAIKVSERFDIGEKDAVDHILSFIARLEWFRLVRAS